MWGKGLRQGKGLGGVDAGGNAPRVSRGTRGLARAAGDVGAGVGVGEGASFWGGAGVGEGEGELRNWEAEARSACSAGISLVMVGGGTGLGGSSEGGDTTELGCSAGPAAGTGVVLVDGVGAGADFGGSTGGEPWAGIVGPLLSAVLRGGLCLCCWWVS